MVGNQVPCLIHSFWLSPPFTTRKVNGFHHLGIRLPSSGEELFTSLKSQEYLFHSNLGPGSILQVAAPFVLA